MGDIPALVNLASPIPTVQARCLQSPQHVDSGLCFLLLVDLRPQKHFLKKALRHQVRYTRDSGENEGSLTLAELEDDLLEALITLHTTVTRNYGCHSTLQTPEHPLVGLAKLPSRCGQEIFFSPLRLRLSPIFLDSSSNTTLHTPWNVLVASWCFKTNKQMNKQKSQVPCGQ